ncbi:TonB-dependent receptor [Pontibacter sp. 172403-2]|uniref:TonB-dependent receptor n=1 Tax=Pontibacter rufus TaxID=2791028 RepID=UPI0018AFA55B|nr:TonB-dependent receptor [Pontibacter sp. 172403-2]MBF9255601.1 TonB-dependent receptor [Pontibacter sp. 172403-2]
MKKLLLLLFLLTTAMQAYAQGVAITGTVQSATGNAGLPGASVLLTNAAAVTTGLVTDMEGNFRFDNVVPGKYTVEVKYLGFKPLSRIVQVQNETVNLGQLKLEEETTTIKEVQVVGRAPLGQQKGDTAQYNAKAFKTTPDASAEDLVTKMPGVTIQDGKIQAQGEDVKQVLVDGKRFFGDDADAALRNLPAEVIESVQVFDKKSDQAEFSGVDDGNREKTINIVTKEESRKGQFGKVAAGYGTDNRYMVGASVNFFNNDRRLTVTGLTNNINMFDFSVGEAPGGGMRGRRGGWGGGTPDGINVTNTIGLNYSDQWGEKLKVSGNYSFYQRENDNNRTSVRDYVNSELNQVDMEDRTSNNTSGNHRFRMRLEYTINENNRLLITPSINARQSRSSSFTLGQSFDDNGPLNESRNSNTSDDGSYDLNNNIYFSHRFGKPGRTISASLNTTYSASEGDSYQEYSITDFLDETKSETRDQYTRLDRNGTSWRSNVTYTEPITEKSRVEVEYNIGNRINDSDRRTYDFVEQTGTYSQLNEPQSNTFRSEYLTQSVETGYNYNSEKIRLQLQAEYQQATLNNDQVFPTAYNLGRTFTSVLPSAELEYKISKDKNLRIDYRSDTDAPSVDELQDVLDISNPLQVRQGNPDLEQEAENRLALRYRAFNPETNKVFFAFLMGSMTQNYITNSSTTGPFTLSNGEEYGQGARFIRPVNLDGYWNVRSFFNYGQPLNFIKTNLNLNGSVGYSRIPGMIDEEINYANTTNLRAGIGLSSNISKKIDFNISTNSSYNFVDNTLTTTSVNNNYFNQSTSLRLNWIFWKGLVYRTELNHQYNSGLSESLDNNFTLWNMSISKKVFKKQLGEISLSVNDLLKQNVSVQRDVTAQYVEDVQSSVLQRYFMLTFSYNIRNFGGKLPDDLNNGGGPRGDWGGRHRD